MATKPNDDSSLSHTRRNCKYHIVFIPKYRRKEIYGQIKSDIISHRCILYDLDSDMLFIRFGASGSYDDDWKTSSRIYSIKVVG